jgi:HNH endonuclease
MSEECSILLLKLCFEPLPDSCVNRVSLKQWERFWNKITITPEGHWLWTGGCFSNGYGCFSVSNKPRKQALAHRWLYQQVKGPLDNSLDLDHILICRIGTCVNWDHLDPVTRSVNALRREEARRLGMPPYAIKRLLPSRHGRNKTHCKRGHLLSGDNVYIYDGRRVCRACKKIHKKKMRDNPVHLATIREADAKTHRDARTRKRGGTPAVVNGTQTHCQHGHAYSGNNLYVTPSGARHCRACTKVGNARAYLKRKEKLSVEDATVGARHLLAFDRALWTLARP